MTLSLIERVSSNITRTRFVTEIKREERSRVVKGVHAVAAMTGLDSVLRE